MSDTGITVDELMAEWNRCEKPDGKGMTTEEIVKATKMSHKAVRNMLREGVEQGRIEAVRELRSSPIRPGWRYNANVFRVVK